MIVPCMVNSWLYCSGVRNCIPGRASSARMNSAIRPPIMNQANDVAMYMTPRTFGSVVCRYCRNFAPRGARCTGYGRVTTGRGATAVKLGLQQVGAHMPGTDPDPWQLSPTLRRTCRPGTGFFRTVNDVDNNV